MWVLGVYQNCGSWHIFLQKWNVHTINYNLHTWSYILLIYLWYLEGKIPFPPFLQKFFVFPLHALKYPYLGGINTVDSWLTNFLPIVPASQTFTICHNFHDLTTPLSPVSLYSLISIFLSFSLSSFFFIFFFSTQSSKACQWWRTWNRWPSSWSGASNRETFTVDILADLLIFMMIVSVCYHIFYFCYFPTLIFTN